MPIEQASSVWQVEELRKRLQALKKSAKPWEERFTSLQKLTEVFLLMRFAFNYMTKL